MKLRIRGNSLRLRLSRTEVDRLRSEGKVEDAIAFAGSARLAYALSVSPEASAPAARMHGGRIEVTLPAGLAREWTTTERVGVEAEEALGDGSSLRILVEKDFACLAPRAGEDDTDAFPHPEADKTC